MQRVHHAYSSFPRKSQRVRHLVSCFQPKRTPRTFCFPTQACTTKSLVSYQRKNHFFSRTFCCLQKKTQICLWIPIEKYTNLTRTSAPDPLLFPRGCPPTFPDRMFSSGGVGLGFGPGGSHLIGACPSTPALLLINHADGTRSALFVQPLSELGKRAVE